jgi:hypothetical protein
MKKLALAVPALFVALPAAAHEGAHLHPHGSETAMLVLTAALVGGAIATYLWRR